ncbi:MAG: SsrA-binding protein, partial [Epsilonproteobacteria bacterium]|nr:SsrA-binding protein [Campylobacterota bacterium]NPA89708.1 SsrA-binding protein [Campylobacterota bacterium]
LIPTRLYFNDRNIAKLEIAVAKGRKLHDKRRVLKERELDREARSAMKRYGF